MKFSDIYNRVIEYWPEEIPISDGYPAGGQEGYMFPTLNKIFSEAEERIGHENGWDELMVWTMYQTFWAEAKRLILGGASHLRPREVSLSRLENHYLENLQCEGWEKERLSYEGGEA